MNFNELAVGDYYTLEKTSQWPLLFKKVSDKHYVTIYREDKISSRYPFQLECEVFQVEKVK